MDVKSSLQQIVLCCFFLIKGDEAYNMKRERYLYFWGTEQRPNYLGIKILGKVYYITCNPIIRLFGSKSMWDLLPNQYTWDCHLNAVPRYHVFFTPLFDILGEYQPMLRGSVDIKLVLCHIEVKLVSFGVELDSW